MTRRDQGSGSIEWIDGPGVKERRVRLRVYLGADDNGRPRQKSRRAVVRSSKEANGLLRQLQAEVAEGHHGGSAASLRTTIESYITDRETSGEWSPLTVREARRFVANVLPDSLAQVAIGELTARQLDRFYDSLTLARIDPETGQPMRPSPATIRRYHAIIRAPLARSVRYGEIPTNPALKVERRKAAKRSVYAPSLVDVDRLVAEAERRSLVRGRMLRLMSRTGIRRGEACGLRWGDFDPHARTLTIARSVYRVDGKTGVKRPKSEQDRLIQLSATGAEQLAYWRSVCEHSANNAGVALAPDGYIFSPRPGGDVPVNPDTLSSFVRKVADELGMPEMHVHSLRHRVGTEMSAITSTRDAAAMLGHARASFTADVYTSPDLARQVDAAEALERKFEALPGGDR